MEFVDVLRWLHVLGACVLIGTGAGIAFFMLMAHRSGDPALIAHVAGTVVIADFIFTASAVVLQPVTGLWLASLVGWDLREGWIALSLALYVVTGVFWLPVVWIQLQLRDMARKAAGTAGALPDRYFELFGIWFLCGIPAFLAVLTILWLMLVKPPIGMAW